MRIAIINSLYPPSTIGGAEISVRLLAEGLAKEGHEVAVICLANANRTDSSLIEERNGVRVVRLPLDNIYWPWNNQDKVRWKKLVWHLLNANNTRAARRLSAHLRNLDPEIIHTNNLGGFSAATWRLPGLSPRPIVHTFRDYSLLCPKNMFSQGSDCSFQCMRCSIWSHFGRRLSDRVSVFVGVSNFVLRRHRRAGFEVTDDNAKVIYNPVQCDQMTQRGRQEDCRHGVNGSARLVAGYIGRLDNRKGISWLLEALEDCDQIEAVWVAGSGDDEFERNLRSRFKSEKINFLGHVPREQLFAKIDVLVVPSRWPEPMGRIVPEAYCFGVPVIVTPRGGLPELVDNGETGIILQKATSHSLVCALDRIREMKMKVARSRCRKKAQSFGVEAHVGAYLEAYRAAVKTMARG